MHRIAASLSISLAVLFSGLFAISAASAAPVGDLNSIADTNAAPGGTLTFKITDPDIGDQAAPDENEDGITEQPRLLKIVLPAGMSAISTRAPGAGWICTGNGPGPDVAGVSGATALACSDASVADFDPRSGNNTARLEVLTALAPTAQGRLDTVLEVSGGGSRAQRIVDPTLATTEIPRFGFEGFDGAISADVEGAPYDQAGGDPYSFSTTFAVNTYNDPSEQRGDTWPAAQLRDISVDLPPGLLGDPSATSGALCTLAQLANGTSLTNAQPLCPTGSQVGSVKVFKQAGGYTNGDGDPLFLMKAPPGVPARLGFNAAGTSVLLDARVRSGGDYGITIEAHDVSEGVPLVRSDITVWGTPASPIHDFHRACPGQNSPAFTGPHCTTEIQPRAFLRMPTSCTPPGRGLNVSARADSWSDPGEFVTAGFTTHLAPSSPTPSSEWGAPLGTAGCADVPFAPSISVTPTSSTPDSPSGLEVDLSLPQSGDPNALATSDLKRAVITLPKGMSLNPSAASGLGSCTSSEIDLHGENTEPSCPESSRIGEVEIETPLLDHTIKGSVYLAAQGDNPFGSLLAMYIVGEDPQSGTVIKLPGEIRADEADGQLEAIFDDQPQLPFSSLHLGLYGGSRAPLRTPPACGSYSAEAELTPWARPQSPVSRSSVFQISAGAGGCGGGGFAPGFAAASENPLGGAFSPFALSVSRRDGEPELGSLDVSLPEGLVAKLAGIPYCPESALAAVPIETGSAAAQLAAPSCPAASKVGSVTVGAGAGTPFYLRTASAYLAGPYKGAPLSLAVIAPALAGPFDLGNVVVRTALRIDPETAQVEALSDSLPRILDGIPLDLRDLRVELSRSEFMLNPTDCDPSAITARATSVDGTDAALAERFQVGSCERLGFAPKLNLKLKGPTKRTSHPKLIATLTAKAGEANIARAQVKLPKAAFLDNAHIKGVCTRPAFATHSCPANSVYGRAKAVTPLLDQPLSGNVYLRANPSHKLPDLVADLDGQIEVSLAGKTDSVKGALRNTFEAVPDAPVSSFRLELFGGKRGLIEMSSGFCRSPKASVKFDAQNGKVADSEPVVGSSCKRGDGKQGH